MTDNEFIDRGQLEAQRAAEEAERRKKEAKTRKKQEKANAKAKDKPAKPVRPNALVQILNGDFLSKEFILNNLNFIFFLILLLLLVVAKGYYGKQLSADVQNTQKELDAISAEYFEAKAKLEEDTRRNVLVDKLASSGLKETVNPTKVIRIKEE
jgi:hypothetical protein